MVRAFLFPTQQQDHHRGENEVNLKVELSITNTSRILNIQILLFREFFPLSYQALKINIPKPNIPESQILTQWLEAKWTETQVLPSVLPRKFLLGITSLIWMLVAPTGMMKI